MPHLLDGTELALLTQSEQLFEQYCRANGIVCQRVPVADVRTPDYKIRLSGTVVACEVKELEQGRDEKEALQRAVESGVGVTWADSNAVRRKLKKVSPQLKEATSQGIPTLLVLHDKGPFRSHVLHSNIIEAMHGELGFMTSFPEDEDAAPEAGAPAFCGNRGVTPDQNTSISALAVLAPRDDEWWLLVYHNVHAAVRLDPSLLLGIKAEERLSPDARSVFLD